MALIRTGWKDLPMPASSSFRRSAGCLPRFKKKDKAKKGFAVDVSGGEEFNEWMRSAKAGHPCEDDAILLSEPLPSPS